MALSLLLKFYDERDMLKESEDKENRELVQELYAQIGELTAKLNWLKKKSGIDVE